MKLVKYPEYTYAETERINTNDAVMGLLVGSKLASKTLESTESSTGTLSAMFPEVEHVHRFDMRADVARRVLEESEPLLGSMAVLYAFGLHEDLIRDMLAMLSRESGIQSFNASDVNSNQLHTKLAQITGHSSSPETLEIFDILRLMRNARIHNGGKARMKLSTDLANLSSGSAGLWLKITGEPAPSYQKDSKVKIGLPELILTLAVTKRLAEESNVALQSTISRSTWLEIFRAHFLDEVRAVGNRNQLLRKCAGFARRHYAPLQFSTQELESTL